jgi:hypothetical protein
MTDIEEKDVFKAVQRKFPVCNVIDYRLMDAEEITKKCDKSSSIAQIRLAKKRYDITVCTGSFNVYVLKIEETV